jgi:hypothetical protein
MVPPVSRLKRSRDFGRSVTWVHIKMMVVIHVEKRMTGP